MTTYTTIPNTDIDQDSPVTQPLMTALRDNPLAIAEADSSVAANLLPTVLLGTLTTTSGSTQTLSSLDLNPYRLLYVNWIGVQHNSGGPDYRLGSSSAVVIATSSPALHYGSQLVDLFAGHGTSTMGLQNATAQARTISTGITNASTSVQISVSAGNFTAGSVRIYGVK